MPPEGTPRRRNARSVASRRAIEAAAVELVGRHGLDGVTVEQIAQAAGISERTFYRHFASKEDVVLGDPAAELSWLTTVLYRQPPELDLRAALLAAIAEDEHSRARGDLDIARVRAVREAASLTAAAARFERQLVDVFAGWIAARCGRPIDLPIRATAAALAAVRREVVDEWVRGEGRVAARTLAAEALSGLRLVGE